MGSSSLPRASDQPEPQAGDLAIDAREIGADRRTSEHVPLFRCSSEARVLIRTLVAHPAFRVSLLTDRTLVGIDGDWWAFGHCGHGLGVFVSESGAASGACRACQEIAASERWAELFLAQVAHAASVAGEAPQHQVNRFD